MSSYFYYYYYYYVFGVYACVCVIMYVRRTFLGANTGHSSSTRIRVHGRLGQARVHH